MKKLISLVLAVAMVLGLMGVAMAATGDYQITVENTNDAMSINGKTYYDSSDKNGYVSCKIAQKVGKYTIKYDMLQVICSNIRIISIKMSFWQAE